MRFPTVTLAIAALGVGSVALAEPSLVVDPWGRVNGEVDSWFAPAANERPEKPRTEDLLVDPWVPAPERAPPVVRAKRVEVFPVAPANAPLPFAPPIIDPWAPVVASEIPSLAGAPEPRVAESPSGDFATSRPSAMPWSGRMIEIVDPWSRMPSFTPSDRIRLVIDPWAR